MDSRFTGISDHVCKSNRLFCTGAHKIVYTSMHHATDIMQFQNYACFKVHTNMYSWVDGAKLGWAISRVSKFAYEIQIVILKITNIVQFTHLFKIYFISRLDESIQNSTIGMLTSMRHSAVLYWWWSEKNENTPVRYFIEHHSFFHHQIYDFIIAKHIPRAHFKSAPALALECPTTFVRGRAWNERFILLKFQ